MIKIRTNNNPSSSNNTNNDQEKKIKQNEEAPVEKLNSNAMSKMTINPKAFGKNNVLFNEADGTAKSIIKIKAMNENEKFSYEYKSLMIIIRKRWKEKKSADVTIKDMVESSKYIFKMFIKFFS